MHLVLGSKSPRRKFFFELLGVDFSIEESSYEEVSWDQKTSIIEYNQMLALNKALGVVSKKENSLVVSSDTIVVYNNEVFGKPKSQESAREALKKLSGKTHEVITSYSVVKNKKEVFTQSVTTKVKFREISKSSLDNYLLKANYLDKAGSYGLQEHGSLFVESIEGSYSSVIGFPIDYLENYFIKSWGDNWRSLFF